MQALLILSLSCLVTADSGQGGPRQGPSVLQWRQLPDLPDTTGFAGPYAGVDGDTLIVAGGANFPDAPPWEGGAKVWHDRIFIGPAATGPWREIAARLDRPMAYGVSLSVPSRGLLCLGGADAQRHYADAWFLRHESPSGTVRRIDLPSMPGPTAYACGALVANTVYVAGGCKVPNAKTAQRTLWTLDLSVPQADWRWREMKPCPGPARMLAVAGALGDAFYLFGGVEIVPGDDGLPTRRYLTDAWSYEPRQGWQRLADLPRPVTAAPTPAMTFGCSHLAILGGDDGTRFRLGSSLGRKHPGFSRDVLAYHPITDTWTTMGELPLHTTPDSPPLLPPVTTSTVPWQGGYLIPSGEVRPGVRTPNVLGVTLRVARAPFGWLDYAVVGGYLLLLVAIGYSFSRSAGSTSHFFLGGQRIPWWAAGLSIFGAQLSAITFVAMPAKAYATDWVYLMGNLLVVAAAPIVIHFYLPFYRRLNVTTAYEYLEKRFNLPTRLMGSLAFILLQVGRMGVILYLPATALAAVSGTNVVVWVIVMGALVTLYTVLGGIEAVIWVDVVQVLVLFGGALVTLALIVLKTEGGIPEIVSLGAAAGKFRLVNFSYDMATTALWVVVLGKLAGILVCQTADQTIVQRYLTTRNESQAARSIWTNALLSIPAGLLFFSVGTALWAFYRTHPQLLAPLAENDQVLPWFIAQEAPPGVVGLVIAALFAASMSSLDSSLNSVATAITADWYRRFFRLASDRRCVAVARLVTVVLGAMGTAFALIMAYTDTESLWDEYLKIIGLFGGGLAGLFLVGIFSRRAHGLGAIVGFLASSAILYAAQRSGCVHLLLFSALGMASSAATAYVASWILPCRMPNLDGLTIYSLPQQDDHTP